MSIHFYVVVGDPYVCIFRPVGGNKTKMVYKTKLADTALGNHTQSLECPWQILQGDIIGLQTHAGSLIGIGFCQQIHKMYSCVIMVTTIMHIALNPPQKGLFREVFTMCQQMSLLVNMPFVRCLTDLSDSLISIARI